MRPTPRRARALFLALLLLTAATATAMTREEELAAREHARRLSADSGHRSEAVVVDGTPRPLTVGKKGSLDSGGAGSGPERSRFAPDPAQGGQAKSLSTQIGEAGMRVPLGGDDVIIAAGTNYDSPPLMRITSDGTCFVAIAAASQVEVWKSTDSGESWALWSTFADPTSSISRIADMELAEGESNRIFLTWQTNAIEGAVRIAHADPGAAVPAWTIVTALQGPGLNFAGGGRIDIHTDAAAFPEYFVYVIATGSDGDGHDVWFTRSVDMGDSYDPGYKIADSATSTYVEMLEPILSYGQGNWVHASYMAKTSADSGGDVVYRRVPSWGDGGAAAWQAEQVVHAKDAFDYNIPIAMMASPTEGLVLLSTIQFGGAILNVLFYSTDNGASWPAANETATGLHIGATVPLILPSGEIVMGSRDTIEFAPENVMELARSTTTDPSTWSVPEAFTRSAYSTDHLQRFDAIAADPTRDQRVAAAWVTGVDGIRTLRFDAEWRRDAGYGNTEVGFPLPVAGGGQTPPAIAEIDGDPFGEIVFGTSSGDIHVLNHDGTPVPGWPVNIGPMPLDGPVAIDYFGNAGSRNIVAGNRAGEVYAFRADGTLMAGFPVQMDEITDVFVSIGALGPPYGKHIVAVCGRELRAIKPNGQSVDNPEWARFLAPMTRPAAIGDVDNDGVVEVVTLKHRFLHINTMGENQPEVSRFFTSATFSDAPTLADVDNDGDLEIAAPTTDGRMFLMHHDGTDVAGWPFTVPSGQALTSASFANIVGNSALEMTFAERDGSGLVHTVMSDGVEHWSFPQSFGSELLYMPPIIEKSSIGATHITVMTPDGIGHNWSNQGAVPAGWPRNLPGAVEETPAGGDIDNDGRTEIVILGGDFLTVLDIGEPPFSHLHARWPMYGFDPARTGCFECFVDSPADVDDIPSPRAASLLIEAYPNPFNPATTIRYEVTTSGPVTLKVFDIRGRVVDVILRGESRSAGLHTLRYEPDLASGTYFLRLESGGEVATQKIGLLK